MKIFCSGIGGIGLSAYAAHMHARGHTIIGTDKVQSTLTDDLVKQGIRVSTLQDGSQIPKDTELFVYSEAIPETSPERVAAAALGIRQISYFHALGELTKGTNLIAICGSHGKSTTTAMIVKIFIDAGLDPNVVLGTKMKELGNRNWRKGTSNLWVVEACEYRRSFLHLHPKTIVVTTIDGDHFDFFVDQADYESAFAEFFRKLRNGDAIIGHGKDPRVLRLVHDHASNFIDADKYVEPKLSVPGKHMRDNARLAAATAGCWIKDQEVVAASLQAFTGTWRRMEVKGTSKEGALVIDDYGHHPTEIKATLAALREGYPGRRIICLFQPHTHHRTKSLWHDFLTSFNNADLLVLTDVYDARPDTEKDAINIAELATAIQHGSSVQVKTAGALDAAETLVRTEAQRDDIILVLGAGNVTDVASRLAS